MVLATYPAGNPRSSLTAAERASAERPAHPDAHVEYDAKRDDFVVVADKD